MLCEGEVLKHHLDENCRKKFKLFLTKYGATGFFFFLQILFCTEVVDENMPNETKTALIKSCILTMAAYQLGEEDPVIFETVFQ